MPYSKDNPQQWASKKFAKVQEVAIRVFNESFASGKTEEFRIATLAVVKMQKRKVKKSNIIKSKYNLDHGE